jgi:hypothetical protein
MSDAAAHATLVFAMWRAHWRARGNHPTRVEGGGGGGRLRLHRLVGRESAAEGLTVSLPQHRDQHRPERPVLLIADQELGERAALRVAPELADPLGALEIGVLVHRVSSFFSSAAITAVRLRAPAPLR